MNIHAIDHAIVNLQLSKKVSADHYHLIVTRAQVNNSLA